MAMLSKAEILRVLTEKGVAAEKDLYTYTNAKQLPGGKFGLCIVSVKDKTLYITDVDTSWNIGKVLYSIPIDEMQNKKHSPRLTLSPYFKFTWQGKEFVLGAITAKMKQAVGV